MIKKSARNSMWGLLALLLIFALIFINGLSVALASDFTNEYVFEEGLSIFGIFMFDEMNGWAVGDKGSDDNTQPLIVHTTDGMQTWEEVEIGVANGYLGTVLFTDEMTGYVAGQDWGGNVPTLIMQTVDGGQTWSKAEIPQVFGSVEFITFSDSGVGWAAGYDFGNFTSLLLRSDDGSTWVEQEHPSPQDAGLSALSFPSEMVGYGVGTSGWENPIPHMIKTEDGGLTWVEVTVPLEQASLMDVLFLDDQNGFVVGSSGDLGIILSTTDGGDTWDVEEFSGSSVIFKRILENDEDLAAIGIVCDDDCDALILAANKAIKEWKETYREKGAYISAIDRGMMGRIRAIAAIMSNKQTRISRINLFGE